MEGELKNINQIEIAVSNMDIPKDGGEEKRIESDKGMPEEIVDIIKQLSSDFISNESFLIIKKWISSTEKDNRIKEIEAKISEVINNTGKFSPAILEFMGRLEQERESYFLLVKVY